MLESTANFPRGASLSPAKQTRSRLAPALLGQSCLPKSDKNISVKTIQFNIPLLLFQDSLKYFKSVKELRCEADILRLPLCFLLFLHYFPLPSSLLPSFDLETKKTHSNFDWGKRKWSKGGHGEHKKRPACRDGEAGGKLRKTNAFGGEGQTQRISEIEKGKEVPG